MSWSNRQSPSVTMSSPATSCSRRYTDNASTYCSRKREVTIASRNDRVPRFSVYQLGRGSDPVMVVGSSLSAVAFSMRIPPDPLQRARPCSAREVRNHPAEIEHAEPEDDLGCSHELRHARCFLMVRQRPELVEQRLMQHGDAGEHEHENLQVDR